MKNLIEMLHFVDFSSPTKMKSTAYVVGNWASIMNSGQSVGDKSRMMSSKRSRFVIGDEWMEGLHSGNDPGKMNDVSLFCDGKGTRVKS